MPERYVEVFGTLRVDGAFIYVGGMDLHEILAAALPNQDDRKYEGAKDFPGHFRVRVEAVSDA